MNLKQLITAMGYAQAKHMAVSLNDYYKTAARAFEAVCETYKYV